MPDISLDNFTKIRIAQVENVIRPLGWKLAAQDQTSEPIKLILTITKEELESARKRFNDPS